MLVGVAPPPPSFLPTGTQAFHFINRTSGRLLCTRLQVNEFKHVGFTKIFLKQMLKAPAFYLKKQPSFIPKMNIIQIWRLLSQFSVKVLGSLSCHQMVHCTTNYIYYLVDDDKSGCNNKVVSLNLFKPQITPFENTKRWLGKIHSKFWF